MRFQVSMEFVPVFGLRTTSRRLWEGVLFSCAEIIGYQRWLVLSRGGRRLPFIQRDEELTGANDYSREAFAFYRPLERVRWPLLMLASIPDMEKESLLIVGPRFESEFLIAEGLGWRRPKIFGLDLLAYSRRVTIGNMHAIPFPDESFLHIVCGWTLSYSKEPRLAASELVRVLAPGGYLVVGVEVVDRETAEPQLPGILGPKERIQSREDFLSIFPDLDLCSYVSSGVGGNALVLMRKPNPIDG